MVDYKLVVPILAEWDKIRRLIIKVVLEKSASKKVTGNTPEKALAFATGLSEEQIALLAAYHKETYPTLYQ